MVYQWLRQQFHYYLPSRCLLCGQTGLPDREICPGCLAALPANLHHCRCCALPLPETTPANSLCGHCSHTSPAFEQVLAPWLYADGISQLILQLKSGRRLPAGRLLGQLLAETAAQSPPPQLLLPVPLHASSLRQRGFNHAAEICRQLSIELGIPWSAHALRKIRRTAPQHRLDRRARQGNLRGCFTYRPPRSIHHVALIDDVMTTGSTATEAARTLRQAGVEQIQVWVVARTAQEG